MSDNDVEEMLRETFRRQDAAAGHGRRDLLSGARARAAATRRRTMTGAALAVAVATSGVVLTATAPWTGGPGPSGVGPSGSVSDPPTTVGPAPELGHDWVWFSSLGLQIGVPGGWALNEEGCNRNTERSSAARYYGFYPACKSAEPPTRSLAIISTVSDPMYAGLPRREVTVSGVPATLAEGRLPDGRYGAELRVPSKRVYLQVRTVDEPERREILRTAHLVDVDHLGCDTELPPVTAPDTPPASLLPPDPARLARLCLYGERDERRLMGSVELDEPETEALVAKMNAAPPGRNPDLPPASCQDRKAHLPDVVVRLAEPGAPANQARRVWITFSGCIGRGMDNGTTQATLTKEILSDVMRPQKVGSPGVAPDLSPAPGDK